MPPNIKRLALAAALLAGVELPVQAQGTAFTYQGRLDSGGGPAAGGYDLAFKVYDTNAPAGTLLAGPVTNAAVAVSNGFFAVTLDFGAGIFTGNARWLEIAVRTNGDGGFTTLSPRQRLTPTPYAIFATSASNLLGSVAAAQLTGTLPSAQLPGAVVTNMETGVTLGGTFSGQGGGLTNLNASQLTSGIVPTNVLAGFQAPYYAFIGGGQLNTFNNSYAVVGGGYNNSAGYLATVPGGNNNQASGYYSFAAGQNASALHQGAFVWADSQPGIFASLVNDTFNVRAQGGVSFVTRSGPVTVNGLNVLTGSAGNFWQTLGNAGTSPTNGNFLGTTDNQPLELRVNNSRAVRIEPNTNGAPNIIAGSPVNHVAPGTRGATISGGGAVNDGGYGSTNSIAASYGVIGGGGGNFLGNQAVWSAVGGGGYNKVLGDFSVVGGGANNTIDLNTDASTIGGGYQNLITNSAESVIGGGYGNNISAMPDYYSGMSAATIAGGYGNFIGTNGVYAAIGGGGGNSATGIGSVIAGGLGNFASGMDSFAGGVGNNASGDSSFAGGYYNTASGAGAIALGAMNTASAMAAVALGTNCVASDWSTVAMGESATASAYGGVAMGLECTSSGEAATAIGFENTASGFGSTALGAYTTAGNYASTALGEGGYASGQVSTAMGYYAQAVHNGTFVWADSSVLNYSSSTSNEFSICAQNGVRIQTDKGIHLDAGDRPIITRDWDVFGKNAPSYKAGIGRWGMFMEPFALTIGIPSNDVPGRVFQVAKYSTNGTPTQLMQVDQGGNIVAKGTVTANGVLLSSDRNAKENFTALDGKAVLASVVALPVTKWNYRTDSEGEQHIGPMAQDFQAAFQLSTDDRHISVVDEGGVALAAIQGLNQKVEEKEAKLQAQAGEIAALKARLEKLEQLMIGKARGVK